MKIIKKIFNTCLIALSFMLFTSCGSDSDSSSSSGQAPETSLERGINIGNALEAPNEGDWGVVIQESYFQIISDGGFDFVRLPINWHSHSSSSSPYTIDSSYFARIDQMVEWANTYGLSIIIDVHHFDDMIYKPYDTLPRLQAIWQQIAERYANQPYSVYFEILNEPNASLTSDVWNDIYPQVLSTIRVSNPDRWVIIDGPFWSNWQTLDELILPDNDSRIIASFHYYNPQEFTHQGAEWDSKYDQYIGMTWTGTDSQKADVENSFNNVADWAQNNNIPVLLGEFGTYYKAPMSSRASWTQFVRQKAEEKNFSWAVWDFNAGFAIYDNSAQQWNTELLDALMK
jgi:endoglucanase